MSRLELSPFQSEIWAASQLSSEPIFNITTYQRFDGPISVDSFISATENIAAQHDAFRIRISDRDGEPVQWVDDEPIGVRVVDLRGEKNANQRCLDWIDEDAARPFDLDGGVLTRITVLRATDELTYASLTAHHVCTDGWGINVMGLQCLLDAAHFHQSGEHLDVAATSFLSHVTEQNEQRRRGWSESELGYIADVAAGEPSMLVEAGDVSDRSARIDFPLSRELVEALRREGYSPYNVMMAAVAIYLSRLNRSTHATIGVALTNRKSAEEQGSAGLFVNKHPLFVDDVASHTFRSLMDSVRASTRTMKANEHIPLREIMRAARDSRSGSAPTFDVSVSYLRMPTVATDFAVSGFGGTGGEVVVLNSGRSTEALSINVRDFDGDADVLVELDYKVDVFGSERSIQDVARYLHNLIVEGVSALDTAVPEIAMLDEEQAAELRGLSAGPAVANEFAETLHGVFDSGVAEYGDRVALVDGATGAELTYRTVDAMSDLVAKALLAAGLNAQTPVAVALTRGVQLPIALLGILKAGCCYVPVDPTHPRERNEYILADCGATLVLCDELTAGSFDIAREIRIDSLLAEPTENVAFTRPSVAGDSLAYMIYTSGSTGKPKGVMIEHRSAVNRLAWMQHAYEITAQDRLLQKTPVGFDVSVWELFLWMFSGASLVVPPPGAEKDPAQLVEQIERHAVTAIHFVPSMFAAYLEHADTAPGTVDRVRSLRYIFCSGEALLSSHARQFAASHDPAATRLVNFYGPTEATVDVSYFDYDAAQPGDGESVPIGRPIWNTSLHVVGDCEQPLPPGFAGELVIAGVGVGRGYRNRPEQTGFRAGVAGEPGLTYRTGDLVIRRRDGALVYLGRLDDQVKIRGLRIELGEIESALREHVDVVDAVAAVRNSDTGARIVAFVVPRDASLDEAGLREHVAAKVPQYMIPALIETIDAIPLTPNGKADRKAIALIDVDGRSATHTEPQTEQERVLAAVWEDVLGAHGLGLEDDFFSVGGDSISALTVRARAIGLGWEFALVDLLEAPTLGGLASRMTPRSEVAAELAPFALVPGQDLDALPDCVDAYPATQLQLGMLFHSLQHPDSVQYHDVFHYSVEMDWDAAGFERAAAKLAARHPALRTTFEIGTPSIPLQVVLKAGTSRLTTVDGTGWTDDAIDAHLDAVVGRRKSERYGLTAPLYHLDVLAMGRRVELIVSFHHAILDGWSVATMVRDLLGAYLYDADLDAAAAPSPGHHAELELRALESTEDRAFWSSMFEDSEASTTLPRLRSQIAEQAGVRVHRALSSSLLASCESYAAAHDVPLKSVLFGAYAITMARLTGRDHTDVGLVTHSRPELAGSENMLGLFLNTSPFRVNVDGGPDAVVRRVTDLERASYRHRHYPMSTVARDLGVTTLVESAFNFIHFHQLSEIGDQIAVHGVTVHEKTNFALMFNVMIDPLTGRAGVRADFDPAEFSASEIARVVEGFTDTLAGLVEPHRDFSDATVLGMFERQVARRPAHTAVIGDGEEITYEELAASAAVMAAALAELGVGVGDSVCIAVDRSPRLVEAVLAVMAAGAVCVPVDPNGPVERAATIMAGVDASVCIVSRGVADWASALSGTVLVDTVLMDTVLMENVRRRAAETRPRADRQLPSDAYILHTSGSTGVPKGVIMSHAALANLVTWQCDTPSGGRWLEEHDRISGEVSQVVTAFAAPIIFDVSFQEIFSTLCSGGRLVIADDATRQDPAALLELVKDHGVQRLILPFVALQAISEVAAARGGFPDALRIVASSGEQLRITPEITNFVRRCGVVVFENQYGPTETHVATAHQIDLADLPEIAPIGRTLPGVGLHLLDPTGRPVPAGTPGEIHLSGVCVSRGYVEGTVGAQGSSPFHTLVVEGVPTPAYATGDLGALLPDGSLGYLGRRDQQLKIRGFRVDPAGVESTIRTIRVASDAFSDCAVIGVERGVGDAILAAALVRKAAGTDTAGTDTAGTDTESDTAQVTALRRRLRTELPDYLVPDVFFWVDEIPLLGSGKRNDRELREVAQSATTGPVGGRREPGDAIEAAVQSVFVDILAVESVAMEDDFFDRGGTSIAAMRAALRIEDLTGLSLPLSAFIQLPTVEGIADTLRSGTSASFDPLVRLTTGEHEVPIFLVHPIGGTVMCYRPLARHFAGERTLYGLQAPGQTPDSRPLGTVEELAAYYVDAIRRVRPEGPYAVAGWSFGGYIAWEITHQLLARGEEVNLALFDSIVREEGRVMSFQRAELIDMFFNDLLAEGPEFLDDVELHTPDGIGDEDRFEFIASAAVERGVLPENSASELVKRLFSVFESNMTALSLYTPVMLDVPVALFRPTGGLPEILKPVHEIVGSQFDDPHNGWASYASRPITVHTVGGDHVQMMAEPHIAELATAYSEIIATDVVLAGKGRNHG